MKIGELTALKAQLRRVERRHKTGAILLILPALLFLILTFVLPIVLFLALSVQNPEMRSVMPRTSEAIREWDGKELPGAPITMAFVEEMRSSQENGSLGKVAKRLNYAIPGFRSMILKTARALSAEPASQDPLVVLTGIDERWGQKEYWSAIQQAALPITDFYLLESFDLMRDRSGQIVRAPHDRAVFVDVLLRTFWISLVVTLVCLLLGYPLAYLLAELPTDKSNALMVLILIPFYSSLLVRTTAWLVLLQREGLVHDAATYLGLFSNQIELVHNRFGVYVAMVHILLPFMVLPIYSVMKGISPHFMRAARSLGGGTLLSFREVYFPLTLPGVAAGCLLVFIQCLGFYVTPALVGGAGDQFVSYYISYFTNQTVNWGMAAALSAILLIAVLLLFWVYNRLVGLDRMKLA
jgi:putative spermidine/putrescine transport system permease protein